MPDDLLACLKVRLENGDYKASEQADNWAGKLVAELFGLDPKADRDRIKSMLAAWLDVGELEIVQIPDAYRKQKPHKNRLRHFEIAVPQNGLVPRKVPQTF